MTSQRPMLPAVTEATTNSCYNMVASNDRILADLDSLQAHARRANEKRNLFRWLSIGSGVLALGSLCLGLVPVALFFLLPTIVTAVVCAKWGKQCFPLVRLALAARVADVVSRDMPDGAELEVRLDLAPTINSKNQIRYDNSRKYFASNWLQIKGRFADSTKYSISVVENYQVKFRKGKRKPKGLVVQVLLAFPEKRYGDVVNLKDKAKYALKIPNHSSLKRFEIKSNAIVMSVKLGPHASADDLKEAITALLLSGYQLLNLARANTRAS